jgi:hypothetical protein
MKGLIWNDETKGAKYEVTDIPADWLTKQRMARKIGRSRFEH